MHGLFRSWCAAAAAERGCAPKQNESSESILVDSSESRKVNLRVKSSACAPQKKAKS